MRIRLVTLCVAALVLGSAVAGLPSRPAEAVEPAVDTIAQGLPGIVWSVAFAPDGRWFASIRQTGQIWSGGPGRATQRLITLPSCRDCGEGGLMGLASSPSFASDRSLYAMYTYRSGSTIGNRVVRLHVATTSASVTGTVLDGIRGATDARRWPPALRTGRHALREHR